jgi:cellobiose-specific phosphotransferase system component IIA
MHNSESNMNQSMPDISSSIVAGDSDYNSAVDLLNNKNYDEARNKAISAKNNFNKSVIQLSDIKDNFTSDTNDVHKKYINTVLNELEIKINATDHLLEAIDNYKDHKNSTGNDYSSQANELMNEALEFQNVRNNLVRENPNLFK